MKCLLPRNHCKQSGPSQKISNIPKVIAYNSGTAGPSLIPTNLVPTYVVSKTKQNKTNEKKNNKMKRLKGFMIKYLENKIINHYIKTHIH